MTKFIDFTLNGISTGAIYAAVALALVTALGRHEPPARRSASRTASA